MPDQLAAHDPAIDAFADRHIGPRSDEQATMLAALKYDVAWTRWSTRRCRRSSAKPAPLGLAEPLSETEAHGAAARARGAQRGVHVADRPRLPRHDHPARHLAQRAREPGLVHRVHAVPARDQPGPARSAPQLPDDGERAHRDGSRQRVAARRGHRRGRGHGDAAPPQSQGGHGVRRRRRRASADDRRRAHPRRTARHRGRGRRCRSDRSPSTVASAC